MLLWRDVMVVGRARGARNKRKGGGGVRLAARDSFPWPLVARVCSAIEIMGGMIHFPQSADHEHQLKPQRKHPCGKVSYSIRRTTTRLWVAQCVNDDGEAPVTGRRGGEARRVGNATTVRVVRWACRSTRGGRQRARGGPVRTGRGARLDCGAPGRPSTTRRRSGAARDDTLGVGGLWWWAVGGANGAASGGTGNGAVGAADGWLLAGEAADFAAAAPAPGLSPTTVAPGAAAAADARGAAVSRVGGGYAAAAAAAADEVVRPRRTGSRPRWRSRQTRRRPNERPR